VLTDLDYKDEDGLGVVRAWRKAGMNLPERIQFHKGFLQAYLALREQLLEVIDELHAADPHTDAPSKIHVTGHSMGGAMAMVAALEIAHLRRCRGYHIKPREGEGVSTCTFAAPRIGDNTFAELFARTFPRERDHWALQVDSDAVPHLPFAAWGFRHPKGIAILRENGSDGAPNAASVPSGGSGDSVREPVRVADAIADGGATRPIVSQDQMAGQHAHEQAGIAGKAPPAVASVELSPRLHDAGETVHDVRPKDRDVVNWATMHDLAEYIRRLELLDGPSSAVLA